MAHNTPESSASAGASAQPRSADEGPAHPATVSVLVPLDGSELAAEALPAAETICAAIANAELICMRALPLTPLPYGLTAIPPYFPAEVYDQLWSDQEQVASEYLTAELAKATARGAHGRIVTERGDPAVTILDVALRERVSLIVMTTHGRTGLARFALGSVADRVVRGGATPVLLLRSFQGPKWTSSTLQRVLTPLDGSIYAEAPLRGIVPQLAGSLIQQIILLHVVDPRDGAEAVARAEDYLAHARQRLLARLTEQRNEPTCAIQTLVRAGPVAATILDAVQSTASGAVIMGTHGEAGIGRITFGTVTDRILRDGQTPLLLAHPDEQGSQRSG